MKGKLLCIENWMKYLSITDFPVSYWLYNGVSSCSEWSAGVVWGLNITNEIVEQKLNCSSKIFTVQHKSLNVSCMLNLTKAQDYLLCYASVVTLFLRLEQKNECLMINWFNKQIQFKSDANTFFLKKRQICNSLTTTLFGSVLEFCQMVYMNVFVMYANMCGARSKTRPFHHYIL